jgi:RNA polymerase sigma factor (sigma-70 family)
MAECASDAILLERFARGHEEAAFVALVQRHGPMVQRICRRILRNEQDVEDVVQATFLILARKAARIPWQDSASGWLSVVARRLAMNARSGSARQRRRETSITALTGGPANGDGHLPEKYHPAMDASAEVERRDLRGILDDELRQLPEKYRAPVVLCYLEGRTHEEAARQLGWPAGSMSRRLDRARSLLRRRLAHRGLAIAVIGLVSAAILAISIGPAPDHTHRTAVVHEAMAPFQPSSESGQDWGCLLAALTPSENLPLEPEQVLRLARQAVRSARVVKEHDPGVLRDLWQLYAAEMERSATDLDQAAQDGNRLALVAAARRLDASCLNCHEIFR